MAAVGGVLWGGMMVVAMLQVLAVQLCEGGSLLRMVEGKQYPVEAQRAALHLLATLCGR